MIRAARYASRKKQKKTIPRSRVLYIYLSTVLRANLNAASGTDDTRRRRRHLRALMTDFYDDMMCDDRAPHMGQEEETRARREKPTYSPEIV